MVSQNKKNWQALILLGLVVVLALILAACGGSAEPQVIEKEVIKTVEVEKEVVKTVEVEKVVVETVEVEKIVEVVVTPEPEAEMIPENPLDLAAEFRAPQLGMGD